MRRKRAGWIRFVPIGCVPVVCGATSGVWAASVQNISGSGNWAGYYATAPNGSAFTDITSTWIIPSLEASSSGTTYSADWIGLDGVGDQTVEQCGTLSEITSGGSTNYYAWYEFFPSDSVKIMGLPVSPGNTIEASISFSTTTNTTDPYAYDFVMSDESTGTTYNHTFDMSTDYARSTAEWIDEAPEVNNQSTTLANFTSVTFSDDTAALDGNTPQPLSALNDTELEMVQNNDVVALPTAISPNGTLFSITYGATGPNLTWDNAGASSPSDGATWDIGVNNNWNNGTNATVYTNGTKVTFNDQNNGHYNINLNSTVDPASVTFNNSSGNYTISGSGSMSGSMTLTKSGSAAVVLDTVNSYTGATVVNAGTLVAGISGALPNNNKLTINDSARVTLAINTGATLSSLGIASTATLDVTNNQVVINYGSSGDPINTITGYLTSGYNNGNWNGPGIASSTAAANSGYALGYADSADPGNPAGLAANQIEIKYTLYGDANLDGTVNSVDFGILAANFGSSGKTWDQGDFTYDGTVNSVDFGLLAENFGQSIGASGDVVTSADWAALDAFAEANGLMSAVPEPASLAMISLAAIGLLGRRRRVG